MGAFCIACRVQGREHTPWQLPPLAAGIPLLNKFWGALKDKFAQRSEGQLLELTLKEEEESTGRAEMGVQVGAPHPEYLQHPRGGERKETRLLGALSENCEMIRELVPERQRPDHKGLFGLESGDTREALRSFKQRNTNTSLLPASPIRQLWAAPAPGALAGPTARLQPAHQTPTKGD